MCLPLSRLPRLHAPQWHLCLHARPRLLPPAIPVSLHLQQLHHNRHLCLLARRSHPLVPVTPPPAVLSNAFVRGGRLSRSLNRCHHIAFRLRLRRHLCLLCLRSVVRGPPSRMGLRRFFATLLRPACSHLPLQLCCLQAFCVRTRALILPARMSVVAETTRVSDVRTAVMPARPVTHGAGNVRLG